MVSPLFGILGGAATKYLADEDASDKIKGNIVDAVSKKIFDIELPTAKKELKNAQDVKLAIENTYGTEFAEAFDNLGYYDSGDIRIANSLIDSYIKQTRDTKDTFAAKVKKMKPEDFKKVFGSQSLTKLKQSQIEDREGKVNNLFADRPNLSKLLVAPSAPQGGIRGALFGGRVKPSDALAVRGQLEKMTETDITPAERGEAMSIFEVAKEQQDITTQYLFSRATTDIGSPVNVAKAAQNYRGFSEGIQTDSMDNVTGIKLAGTKQVEYNAFTSVMGDLGYAYKSPEGGVNLTALAEAANQQLTAQTQGVMSRGIFNNYNVLTLPEKQKGGGIQTAAIQYGATGFKEEFNNKYKTDIDKVKALLSHMSSLGSLSEQQYFAQSLPNNIPIQVKGQQQDLKSYISRILNPGG